MGVNEMQMKLLLFLLIGVLIGSLLGGIIIPSIMASDYLWQLDDVLLYLEKIDSKLGNIDYNLRRNAMHF